MKEVEVFRIVQEIISNSFDESSVKNIRISIRQANGIVIVECDDDGVGFVDMQDVYTMYKHSYKRKYKDKIGKFNLGEKQFFVLCEYGYVKSRNRMIEFRGENRIEDDVDFPRGTKVYAEFNWKAEDVKEILRMTHRLIVPAGKTLTINETPVRKLDLFRKIENVSLFTEIENDETHVMRRIKSMTDIELYNIREGERPWLYNLGVPVQQLKHSMQWHVNVLQKIPLGVERDKVSEAWLEDMYSEILNNAPEVVTEENSGSKWVSVAMTNATRESAEHVIKQIWGNDPIYFKSTNHHANEQAIESGGQLVPDRLFDGETRKHLSELGIVEYAGDVFKVDFVKARHFEPTERMMLFVRVMTKFSIDAGLDAKYDFVSAPESTSLAQTGNGVVRYNVALLGEKFFDEFTEENIGLTLHELAHIKEIDEGDSHLSMDYVHELERLAGLIGLHGISYYQK